jgi:gamma-aminobutyric acid type B receptor
VPSNLITLFKFNNVKLKPIFIFKKVNSLILPICSTAIYAAMLTKAWRIYKIFETTPKMKRVVIKDIRLVIYIGCMIMIDALIVIVWYFVDTIKLKPRYVYETLSRPAQIVLPASYSSKLALIPNTNTANHSSYIDSSSPIIHNSSHISQLKVVFECDSNYNEVWITILTMYKIILLMYGIYLAWIIRNINVPSMNDSKYLLLSTYTIIVCGLGSMTLMQVRLLIIHKLIKSFFYRSYFFSKLLRDWPDVVQAFFTIGVVLATCTTQCLVFIPKVNIFFNES